MTPTQSDTLRRYIAIVQDPRGYPAPGRELEPAPPEGAAQPMIYSVVKADEHDALVERLLKRVALTPNEAALLEVLAREEAAKHKHPPHALLSARDKLRAIAEDV